MMDIRYETLIETLSEIVNNENIYKEGLTLVYEIEAERHKKLDEHLYLKTNPNSKEFTPSDVVEIEIAGIGVKLVKKK
jgi:tRNA U34 5-carboxymethylaminomethyl modifying GTPase MnmE/TrmE